MAPIIPIWWLLIITLAFGSAKSFLGDNGYGTIGGELANITELPHQVYFKNDFHSLWCGGSIISPKHILTSSMCIDSSQEYFKVVAATADSLSGGEEYTIAKVTKHPNSPHTDLAVVELVKELKLSEKARPIALAGPKYRIKDGAELIASGWGESNRKRSDKLRKVTIAKVSDDECKDTLDSFNPSEQFCAGGKGKKACLFDEGGPLIEKTGKGNILVGVINNYNEMCDRENIQKPALSTRVSTFNKWIKQVVKT